jgi:RHS repeat-associated protein
MICTFAWILTEVALGQKKTQARRGRCLDMLGGTPDRAEYAYRGNTIADAVHDFYSGSPLLGTNIYQANYLWVTQETDENERKKWTFTDKLGRVVLVKQELNATETAQTYTVYDDFGRVLCVIPPETTKRMISSPNNWDYNHASYASMIFKYAYDSRGRMTSKTVPSGGTTSIAYDRLDRPVLSTDAKSFKVFTRYDILSRPIVSGKYKGAGSPGATDPLFESSNTTAPHYYTSTSFPTDNNLDVYKVFYYDDYDLDNNGSLGATETYTNPAESGYDATAFLRTRGKPSASKVSILLSSGLAPTTFLTTRTYYDKEYSVIQVNKQNHLGGADISSSAYDFANRVTKTRRDHTATPPGGALKTYYIREEYTYDAASRLRFTRHHISTTAGVPTAGWVVTSAPLYDELGRLLDKRLHASNYDGSSAVTLNSTFTYLQSLDYTYNIRGWLTGINDPTICTAQSGDDAQIDLFRMSLEYESTANGGTAQYNGNISTIQWNTYINGTCGTRHLYRFGYDYSNRLTAANYRARVGATWVDLSKYTENNITYDLNGNLKTYFRRGNIGASLIDNLTYTYGDAARPDRLTNMVDAGDAAKGFKYTSGAADYSYDLNGNMTQDNHKGFTFAYNYLNLPQTMTQGANVITLTYTAGGEKLTKALSGGGATKSYISGIEYSGTNLEAIYFSEGRCTPNGASAFYYDYTIKDHLGNARENFRASGGTAITHLEDMHYYPFGMLMEGMGMNSPTNDYTYNGKELNEDFVLNLHDYRTRWYDAALGRWWSLDPMGEKYTSSSSYNYALNNPIKYTDPTGMYIELGYTDDKGNSQTVKYNYGDKYEGDVEFFKNTFAQLDYLMANSPIETNIIADLAENQEFGWKIENTTWERLNKPPGEKKQGDGLTTQGQPGSNLAATTYYDLIGFETNTGGRQSPVSTLYHEGGHAFIRLQQYNMAKSGDKKGAYLWEDQLNGPAADNGYLSHEEQLVNETYEVPLAQYMGEGVRNGDYGHKKYQTAGPLTNQPSTVVGPPALPVGYYNKYTKQ